MTEKEYPIVTTNMLVSMMHTADRLQLNRRLVTEKLEPALDPEGIHVVVPVMMHNESEMRCKVLMKFASDDEPHEGMIDIPFDAPKSVHAGRNVTWDDVQKHSEVVYRAIARHIKDEHTEE